MRTDENNPADWFSHAIERLYASDILRATEGPSSSASYLLHQSIERLLKGYLISKGWRLEKTRDLCCLVREAVKTNPEFEKYYDMSEALTRDFRSQQFPGGDTTNFVLRYDECRERSEEIFKLVGVQPRACALTFKTDKKKQAVFGDDNV